MAAARVAIKVAAVLCLTALFIDSVAGQKCKTKWNYSFNWEEGITDYIIAYNISDVKNEKTCYDIFDNYHGPGDNIATHVYKINGVAIKEDAKYLVDENDQFYGFYVDRPDARFDIYIDQPVSGVAILYICAGTKENTIIAYHITKPELAAVADGFARKLTDKNLEDYRILRDDC